METEDSVRDSNPFFTVSLWTGLLKSWNLTLSLASPGLFPIVSGKSGILTHSFWPVKSGTSTHWDSNPQLLTSQN